MSLGFRDAIGLYEVRAHNTNTNKINEYNNLRHIYSNSPYRNESLSTLSIIAPVCLLWLLIVVFFVFVFKRIKGCPKTPQYY